MASYYYNNSPQSSPRGRTLKKEGEVVAGIIMMEGMCDTNGQNIKFLSGVIEELIEVVNNQEREILKLREGE